MLLIVPNKSQAALNAMHQSIPGPCLDSAPRPILHGIDFFHHCRTKENNVKFMHQSLCNPPKSSLLAAVRQGFLRDALQLTTKTVIKYLPPSPATSKRYMNQPRQGLCSTAPKLPCLTIPTIVLGRNMPGLILPANQDGNFNKYNNPPSLCANLIDNNDDRIC
jgi:hypothetical protein